MQPTFPRKRTRNRRSPRKPDTNRAASDLPRTLRFTAFAWAKLHRWCHTGETEVAGFGLTHADDPLLVVDLLTPQQTCTSVSVVFDDDSVADLLDEQVDAGRRPEQVLRIWCHTHPGSSPHPSPTDEATFQRVFGGCDWAVMFILARGGETYARLRFHVGPGGEIELPVAVDYDQPFAASDFAAWDHAYQANVTAEAEEAERGPVSRSAMRHAAGVLEPDALDPAFDLEDELDDELDDELQPMGEGFDPLDEPWASLLAGERDTPGGRTVDADGGDDLEKRLSEF